MSNDEQSTPEELAKHQRQLQAANDMAETRRRRREGPAEDMSYPSNWLPSAPVRTRGNRA
ncbi:hypothetical protein [Rhodococcoides fascians]|uniref:hypothetical protein n=1 Tax=Rhodococcoides fascians TaxID=1828 RepID=UPI00050C7DC7|nr:hypothetical protein [Rhodococcus fascians]